MPIGATELRERVARDGFAVARGVLSDRALNSLRVAADAVAVPAGRGGVRDLFNRMPAARSLAANGPVRDLAAAVLGNGCFAVRGILFDKTPESNWKVPWHRDETIAVAERVCVEGFGPWSAKAGVLHVRPPRAVLDRMVTVRVHLDDCGKDNGPLRVIPGSDRMDELTDTARRAAVCPTLTAGDVLVMRPLLWHASSPSRRPERHRRVIHVEFAADRLPLPLAWRECRGASVEMRYAGRANSNEWGPT